MTTTRPVHVPAGMCSPSDVSGTEIGQERLMGEHAAVYADVLPGDEGGFVTGQEDHQRGDVLRAAEAGGERVPQHDRVHRIAAGLLRYLDEAGRDRVAPYALLAELGRRVPGQADQRGLGRAVGRGTQVPGEAGARGRIDHRAAAA